MTTEKNEKLKTGLIVFLVLLSVFQIGIHWSKQSQGLPFNFLSAIFASNGELPTIDVEILKERYFRPEAVIVSIGKNFWKLNEMDERYNKIWEDIRDNYLPVILKKKADAVLPKERWPEIAASRGLKIDFLVNWPGNVVGWFEETSSGDSRSFEGIKSIVIVPEDNVNQTINTVYIYDEKQVCQYQVNIEKDYLPKNYYARLADELTENDIPRQSLLSSYPGFVTDIDIFVPGEEGYNYSSIEVSIPEAVVLSKDNIENYNIQDSILLQQKESLSAQYSENSDNVMFTDTENLYRLYKDGVLEYKYIPADTAQAGEASAAFNHAISFIEHRRSLVGEADIVLTRVVPEKRYYLLEFSYRINGAFAYYSDSEGRISAPIEIKANSERILECRWIIRKFSSTGKQYHSESFGDLLNKQIVVSYPEIINRETRYFSRLEQGYVFSIDDTGGELLMPGWIISTGEKDYFIPFLEKKG